MKNKKSFSSFAILNTAILGLAGTAMANSALADGIGDYNVGGAISSSFEIGGGRTVGASAGIFANGEWTSLDATGNLNPGEGEKYSIKDIVFFDARLTSFIGAGVAGKSADDIQGYFHLKLLGSISGGLMVYQILPVNLGLEDASIEIRQNQVLASSLIGTTVILPVSLIAGMDDTQLYVSVTAGMRLNTELDAAAVGIQPKIRFVTDKLSLEAKALFTVGSDESERKVSLMAGFNHAFTKGDQIGLMASYDQIVHANGESQPNASMLIYYGKNL